MRIVALIGCLLLCAHLPVFSQNSKNNITGIITGNIIDTTTGKGIAGASIQLQSLDDSSRSKSLLADKDGGFEINDIVFGYYSIIFTSVGMSNIRIDSIHVREERFDFNLGDIKMYPSVGEMSEVIVYAEKPLIEMKDGAIVYNVGESALSAGSSTSELLKNMPLISNDANGKILLKGKEPKILIDDKPTDLTAQQLADLLESMPGSLIEKIELMSNPPPQYASETGGVINIVTKKGKVGLTGRINLSYGTRGEGNLSGNISYREKKAVFGLTAGAGASQLKGDSRSTRENYYTDSTSYFNTASHYTNKNLRPNLRGTFDYEFNKRSILNVTALFNANLFDNNSETEYINRNQFKDVYRFSRRGNATKGTSITPSGSVSYTYKGKKSAREVLRFIGSFNSGGYDNERNFSQVFLFPDGSPTGVDSLQRQNTDNSSFAWSARLNYDKPLSTKIILTSGAYYSNSSFHNTLVTSIRQNGSNELIVNTALSNDFRFIQGLGGLNLGLNIDLSKKWRLIAGTQMENTQFHFKFTNGTADLKNDYRNFLPYLTLRKEWIESGWSSSLVYRRTIRRPGIGELNPSIDFSDPYNTRFGNPSLLPQLADNFDWSVGLYKGKFYVNASAGYNEVSDIIQTIRTLIPGDKTQVTYQNITDRKEYEFTLWGGYTFSRKLRMNLSSGYNYNQYSEYDQRVNRYRNGGSFYTSLNYTYNFSDRIILEGNVRYNSIADAQGRSTSNIKQNLGLMTKWMNKQLTISLNLIDVFAQQQFITYTYGKNFSLENISNTRTRNIRISVGYNLKKNKKVDSKQRKALEKHIQKK